MSKPVLAVLALIGSASALAAETRFPEDYKNSCGVSQQELDRWFSAGQVKENAPVVPADSFAFPPVENTLCDFYHWGAQMFLWLTSPDGGGGQVFDSAGFYDVVARPGGGFAFAPSSGSAPNAMQLRGTKPEDIGNTGQAGGHDVLISQAKALTYYGIHANDIFADYRTGQYNGLFKDTPLAENFPDSREDMEFLQTRLGVTYDDPEVMTMELKTSWVPAASVAAADYVTIQARVPSFDKSDPKNWKLTGTEIMELAMVGMHIAAPVHGHPELVWSTFEHVSAAPIAPYYYLDTGGAVTAWNPETASKWIYFPEGGQLPPQITPLAKTGTATGNIIASGDQQIGPVTVAQLNPWGLAPAADGAADKTQTATDNTDLVSLNASLRNILFPIGDVRANYLQAGGIWTVQGQLPSGGTDPAIRGGDRLANSTMETFHQYPNENNGFVAENCFFCHNDSSGTGAGVGMSHIFGTLQPLQK